MDADNSNNLLKNSKNMNTYIKHSESNRDYYKGNNRHKLTWRRKLYLKLS